jgi:asparaginyl-tRNA synthetase
MSFLKVNLSHLITRQFSSIKRSSLREVIARPEIDKNVTVRGWIKTVRAMKSNIFVDINDGSTGENLQLVCNKEDKPSLGFGSSIEASGLLSKTPKGQLEVKVSKLNPISSCPLEGYPYVAKQSYAPEYIRENLHLRSRVSSFNSMARCRHTLTNAINNYLDREGFIQIHTPILTGKSKVSEIIHRV